MRTTFTAIVIALLTAAAGAVCAAQTPPALPAFDAVSVRPFVPHAAWHRDPQVDPRRLFLEGMTASEMIVYAYGLHNNQLTGLPVWAQREFFQVTGVTDKPATANQMRLMLRRVLATRFQFAYTDTTAVQPVYDLVPVRGGPKLLTFSSGSAADCEDGILAYAHAQVKHLTPPLTISFIGCTIPELINLLNAGRLDRPVIDKTGLTGTYSMMVWQLERGCTTTGRFQRCEYFETFPAAMKRELGLDLIKATAPYRVLHATRIEPPAAQQ